MKCIVCEAPTFIAYKLGGIEAAFCPTHVPKERILLAVMIRINK